MKHQPYQLDPSLFTYGSTLETKSPSPKPAPTPDSGLAYSSSPVPTPTPSQGVSQVKATGPMGRSCSLSLPRRLPSMSSRSDYGSPVSTPVFQPSYGPLERQTSWLERAHKPPSPWEAACRSPLGLVDDAFNYQTLQQSIASNVRLAAQRKSLPEPPAEWKARVSYEPQRAPPAFTSSHTKSAPAQCGPPFRQYQPQRSVTEAGVAYAGPSYDYQRQVSQPGYRPMYNAAWRR
ncbi:hypothetical protein JZ751_016536 [Albula glossodonta]|uniref:Uncharacterized protein n=1 Tax=Albula glossodonta TaxID=121402 RepID=A0A8T2NTV1_9TELE|nr:hypothetical protein JZ751_016536 [Albula glossodonta]